MPHTQAVRKPSRPYLRRGHPLTNGNFLAHPFFAGAGTTLHDVSGRDQDGTIDGGTWVTEGLGAALDFDGTSPNTVDLGDNLYGNSTFSGKGITVQAWVTFNSIGSSMAAFNAEGAIKLIHKQEQNDDFEFALYDGSNVISVGHTPSGGANTGQLYHHVGAWDGSTMFLYVDGVQEDSTAFSGPIELDSLDRAWRYASAFGNNGAFWDGSLTNIVMWNRHLPEPVVRHLSRWPFTPYITKPR